MLGSFLGLYLWVGGIIWVGGSWVGGCGDPGPNDLSPSFSILLALPNGSSGSVDQTNDVWVMLLPLDKHVFLDTLSG